MGFSLQEYLVLVAANSAYRPSTLWRLSHLARTTQWQPTSVLLPGKSHGQSSLVGCSPWGHEESDMTERLHFHFSLSCIGEGNGNPLQCSCLENPRDRRAWWLPSMGSHRAGHNWSDLAATATCLPSGKTLWYSASCAEGRTKRCFWTSFP